jgi:hypothetical protein
MTAFCFTRLSKDSQDKRVFLGINYEGIEYRIGYTIKQRGKNFCMERVFYKIDEPIKKVDYNPSHMEERDILLYKKYNNLYI